MQHVDRIVWSVQAPIVALRISQSVVNSVSDTGECVSDLAQRLFIPHNKSQH